MSCSLAVSHLLEDLVDVGGVALGTLFLPLSSGSDLLGGLGGFLAGLLGHFDSFCGLEMTSFDLVRICLLYVGATSYGWLFDRDVARLRDLIIISVAAPALSKLTHF